MSPRSAPVAFLVARVTISSAVTDSTTPRTAAAACTLGHEFRNEACDGRLAKLRHCTRAPPPLPSRVIVITTLLRGTATTTTTALLRGAACTATACTDARAVEVALALELGEI